LSFFDEGEDEAPTTSARAARPRPQRPRRPSTAGGGPPDRQTLLIRRGVAFGVGLVLLFLIIFGISGCLKSQKLHALKTYNTNTGNLVTASDQQVSNPLFTTLSSAQGKNPLDVEVQINQLRILAAKQAQQAQSMSVPGDMSAAQRDLVLMMNFRAGGVAKIAALIRAALGSTAADSAINAIAGDMEIFLASDVIYSQRVRPLIQQALNKNGIHDQTTPSSQFLPNLGWLSAAVVRARLTGQASASSNGPIAPGTHGHGLAGVSVGANALTPAPTLNRVSGGSSPTFTVMVANQGTNDETNVKVDVGVVGGGKQQSQSRVIPKTTAGSTTNVDIPVPGVPLGVATRVTVTIEPVPGEVTTSNNTGTYTVVFGP
jgi:hypothetical protein